MSDELMTIEEFETKLKIDCNDTLLAYFGNDQKKVDRFTNAAWQVCKAEGFYRKGAPAAYYQGLWRSIELIARLGLKPGKAYSHVAIVERSGIPQPMIMYQGWLEIVYRHPLVSMVIADVIYKGDFWEDNGKMQPMKHKRKLETNEILAAYCTITLKNGACITELMSKADIDTIKSKATTQNVWNQFPQEMAKKSVIRRAIKTMPRLDEIELAELVDNEDFTFERAKTQKTNKIQEVINGQNQ